ncbi:TDP-N-acetylfucosamine:lipid II N-acetylfucosaminyltransferase [Flavobacterium sp. ACN6]|uniref:TDP-N-acetylfucosamine:lipid II N-acetylfucosaminyltransferase n=1 Tax=Flavobacterium sp. ACN6 TaxID=1920426 RepID=UPI000BB34E8E|nr:TDP-N-acetylfucosamine:lipid II N-acetylfucosaminyltransferase [Flavobacterium sp. ACN6]PBJ13874.1 4-alpha-L-fucosyltransferase [Flavobacterium sp. ACN6]
MEFKAIVNVMPDDKFLDYYIDISEKLCPEKSSYVVFSDKEELNFIKSKNPNLVKISNSQQSYLKLSKFFENVSVVIFHSFIDLHLEFINEIPENIVKVWLFWGHEGYGALPSSRYTKINSGKLLYPHTLFGKLRFWKDYILNYYLSENNRLNRSIIKKMDYCATWVDRDYDLAKIINQKIKRLYFSYYSNELMGLDKILETPINKNRVLLGNSGNHSNNHIEALELLHKKKFSGEIICPLSYSGSNTYIRAIEKKGYQMFNKNFIPLLDFMPLHEYQDVLNSCGIVWMNHIRQQAAGNLFAAFCTKKIVVLDEENPMIKTFEDWGLHFLKTNKLDQLDNLDIRPFEKNRDIILSKIVIKANEEFFVEIEKMIELKKDKF